MMHLTELTMEVNLGTFHNVAAVAVGDRTVSIIKEDGLETILAVFGVYDKVTEKFRPFEHEGTFGTFENIVSGAYLEGVCIGGATKVVIEPSTNDLPEWDFHRRFLKITRRDGIVLFWTLFCTGKNPLENEK